MWTRSVYTYLGAHIPMHIVYYENLVADPMTELKKIVKFLDLNVDRLGLRLLCALTDLDSDSFKPRDALNTYEIDYQAMINRHIGNVRKTLEDQRRDFETLPAYEDIINLQSSQK